MYVVLSLSIVRRAIIQCRLLFCVHNSTFQYVMRARAARDELGGAGRTSTSRRVNLRHSVYIKCIHSISIQRAVDAARAAASCV